MYQVPSYWVNSNYMRVDFVPIWNTGFPKAVQMIKEAVQGERNDERGHNKMFREMYRALTGQEKFQASVVRNMRKCNPIQKVYSAP